MNTFIPHDSFAASAASIDSKRLLKQVVECDQLLRGQWAAHPAARMWAAYHPALRAYRDACRAEWLSRGGRYSAPAYGVASADVELPWWLGDVRVHHMHQANLVRKLPAHYQWPVAPMDGYWWPVAADGAPHLHVRLPRLDRVQRRFLRLVVAERVGWPTRLSGDKVDITTPQTATLADLLAAAAEVQLAADQIAHS